MSNQPPEIPNELENALLAHLQDHTPIQEHALLTRLTEQGFKGFKPSLNELELFQAHFLLFHLLYRLQHKWFDEQIGWLEIYTLNIQLHPIHEKHLTQLARPDGLRDYYLNYQHLINTQAADVLELLDDFWRQFETATPNPDLQQALLTLEIPTEIGLKDLTHDVVNLHYRKLSVIHHPDKGGQTEDFQALSVAANQLREHLKNR